MLQFGSSFDSVITVSDGKILISIDNCVYEKEGHTEAIQLNQLDTFLFHRLEVQLDDANTVFRSLLSDSTHHLKSLSKKLGSCIEKAR